MDTKTGQIRELLDDWDKSPKIIEWNNGDKEILLLVEDYGIEKMFVYNTKTEYLHCLCDDHEVQNSVSSFIVLTKHNNILSVMSGMDSPPQLYVLEDPSDLIDTKRHKIWRQISEINTKDIYKIQFGKQEIFWFKGADSRRIYGWVIWPHNYQNDKSYPLAFLVHGGPQSAWNNNWSTRWNPQLYSSMGYFVVMINFHGSTGLFI